MPRRNSIIDSFRSAGRNALAFQLDPARILGAGENALAGATAFGTSVVAGPVAAYHAARSGSTREYGPMYNAIMQRGTYQPRTASGQALQNALAGFGEGYSEAIRRDVEAIPVDRPIARTAARVVGEVAPALVPAIRPAITRASSMPRSPARVRQMGAVGDLDEWAAKNLSEGKVPDGWFVHGRARRTDLDTGDVLQMTRNTDVAESYGKDGSVWMARPRDGANVLDLSSDSTPAMNQVARAAVDDFRSGRLPFLDEIESALGRDATDADIDMIVREEFSPSDIVTSARAYDNDAFKEWLADRFDRPFVITKDGAVIFDRDAAELKRAR